MLACMYAKNVKYIIASLQWHVGGGGCVIVFDFAIH